MSRLTKIASNKAQRASRTRAKIRANSDLPRLSVKIANKNISVQLIDDAAGATIASATTIGSKLTGNMTDKAIAIGGQIAEAAKKAKVKKAVLDRGDHKYHGRLKALADAAREKGLEL
ncbi:MAG: 50S ribosomal protein L18 [Patescibacteria group bacterium]